MTPPAETPVFNCIVNVAPTENGVVVARVANLAGIEGGGRTEREALAQVVAAFKTAVGKYHAVGAAIPWLAETAPPAAGEIQRFIAVHL